MRDKQLEHLMEAPALNECRSLDIVALRHTLSFICPSSHILLHLGVGAEPPRLYNLGNEYRRVPHHSERRYVVVLCEETQGTAASRCDSHLW